MFDIQKFRSEANIVTNVDDLIHVVTHSLNFHKSTSAKTTVGSLTIIWRYDESEGEASKEWIPDKEKLELQIVFRGKLPDSPFSFLSLVPEQFGTVKGNPVYLNFWASALGKASDVVALTFSIYVKSANSGAPAQAAPAPVKA